MRGVPLRVVAELMGHQNIQMTMRYAHLGEGNKLAAVRELASFQAAPTGTKTDTEQKEAVSV
jgi:site-specific recombinase XerD